MLGLALMLSTAAVYFRDLQHLLGIVLQVWFYSAPIVYPMTLVQEQFGHDRVEDHPVQPQPPRTLRRGLP